VFLDEVQSVEACPAYREGIGTRFFSGNHFGRE
jgi:hypothetical protein